MLDAELERYINRAVVDAAIAAIRASQEGPPRPYYVEDLAARAAEGSVALTPSVQSLLVELARESVILREDEWAERTGVSPRDMIDSEEPLALYAHLVPVFTEAMQGAEELRRERRSGAPLIALVEWIKDHWCGVFPLCQ